MTLHAIIPAAGIGRRIGDVAAGGPKSLLPVAGVPILARALALLPARGVGRVTVITGFEPQRVQACVAGLELPIPVDFAHNPDYAVTEHGYSLFLARDSWTATRRPVLLMDADNVIAPALLDRLLGAPATDCVLVDPTLDTRARDEELVLGAAGRVTGFVRGRAADHAECVGAFVGMNRFGPDYVARLFAFMEQLFAREGRGFKYERVFHRLLEETGAAPGYLDTGGLGWVNVNHPEDLARATALVEAAGR